MIIELVRSRISVDEDKMFCAQPNGANTDTGIWLIRVIFSSPHETAGIKSSQKKIDCFH